MITNGRVTIGTVATAIDGVYQGYADITLHNDDNTDSIYLGGTGVTINNGLTLNKLETISFRLSPLSQIYAVSAKEGHTISYLRQTI